MRTVFNNSEVCHVWANQSQDEGRNPKSSIFFVENVIYSYGHHYPMAVIHNDFNVILHNSCPSSVTTERHKGEVMSATWGKEQFVVPHIGVNGLSEADHKENLKHYAENAEEALKKAARARLHHDWHIRTAKHSIIDAKRYMKAFSLIDIPITFDVLLARLDRLAEDKSGKAAKDYYKAVFKEERERKAAERKAELEKNQHKFDAWRRGERIWLPHHEKQILRLAGDRVETSGGVRISQELAQKFYEALKAGLDLVGQSIDGYRVRKVTKTLVKIGCHTIDRKEIENFAALMGW